MVPLFISVNSNAMGYNGMGYQRWIATMKPRKFLGKRTKPDGGGVNNNHVSTIERLYRYKNQDISYFRQKTYSESKRRRLLAKLLKERHQQNIFLIISLVMIFIAVAIFFIYLIHKLDWF